MDSLSRDNRKFYIILGAIVFAHVVFMATKIKYNFSETSAPSIKAIKVTLVQKALNEMALSQRRQIAQSEDSASSEKKKDSFLSDKDRSFDRQTIAKNVAKFNTTAKGDSNVTNKAQPKEAAVSKKAVDLKNINLSDLGLAAGEPMPRKMARAPASESTQGMKNGDSLAKGLSATNDYVEEVALGDFTHLNTVEYKFYGFYHRIRQKLEQFWGKGIQEKAEAIFRSGRRLPASENLITSLQVSMNEKGEIISVKILGASGVKELDDAAIESFNQAGPFPNPPRELLVNGKATIDWGFVVKS